MRGEVRWVADPSYELGLPDSMTGLNGPATTIRVVYDGLGRPVKVVRPGDSIDAPTLQVTYSDSLAPFPLELRQRIEGSTYATWRKYYNGLGQLIQSQTLQAQVWDGATEANKDIIADTWYDAYGRAFKQSVPYALTPGTGYRTPDLGQAKTQTSYDALGRTLAIIPTDNITPTIITYGVLTTTVKDAKGNATTAQNDIWGRTTVMTPPMGPGVSYAYNTLDQLTQVIRGGSTMTMTYDYAGRKTAMNDPDMGAWRYSYDALGNLLKQTDAKNQRTCLYYDPLNRLVGKYYQTSDICPTNPNPIYAVQYFYDDYNPSANQFGKGKRTSMADATGSAVWVYDTRGRLTSETKNVTGQGTFLTQWAYNSADLQTWMVYPDDNQGNPGELVNTTYTKQLTPDSLLSNFPQAYVLETRYDAAGRAVMREMGNAGNLVTQYTYNPWTTQGGRLQSISSVNKLEVPPAVLQNLQYTYDAVGNVLNIRDYVNGSPQTQSFTYDNLYRLTSAGASGGSQGVYGPENYSYDATTGNLASKTGVGSYTYLAQSSSCPDGALSKAHAVTTAGTNSYCYDRNGNMVRRNIGANTYNLSYDAENRMVQVSGAVTETFRYNGDGQRIVATQGVTTTVYIGSYFEWHGTPADMVKYYYSGATRVAMRVGATPTVFLMGDHLGSTSVAVDEQGAPVGGSPQLYYAWGETRAGSVPTKYQYTGQFKDSYIKLYWYGSRWYDPELSRWIQPDTIVPEAQQGTQAWDRFSYVNNSPINNNDPTGHMMVAETDGGGGDIDEPPPPADLDILNKAKEFLQNLGIGAVGVRVNGSAGYYVGVTGSIDFLANINTGQVNIYGSLGLQGYCMGGSLSGGGLAVFDIPNNDAYTGYSGGLTGSYANGLGVDASLSVSKDAYQGSHPVTLYIGVAGGVEGTVGVTGSKTWNFEQILSLLGF